MNYRCPFNYVGSKSQILPIILKLLQPYKDLILVDLFAGGFSIGANSENKKVIYNDINNDMMKLVKIISETSFDSFDSKLRNLISSYDLSKTNKEAFLKLRKEFNESKDSYLFALLIYFSFNHQIRYNQALQYNTPFGINRSSYNDNSRKKLRSFSNLIENKSIKFYSKHFEEIAIDETMIVYVDPPYLLTTGSYNDGKRGVSSWGTCEEKRLYIYLKKLDKKKIPFILSNMLSKGDKVNHLLQKFSKGYNIIEVDTKYKNYKRKNEKAVEIIVTNIDLEEIEFGKNN